jgi:Ca2+-dependent lipid-binding protein
VACSRERVEDELIGRIRLNSLLIALYINSSVLIILSLFCYELLFLNVLVFNMFTNIIIFLIVFEMKLWKLKKSLRDEE